MAKRLYFLTIDANDGRGVELESFEISNEGKKGVSYKLKDGTWRHYSARNMYVAQVSNHGTRARSVFPCPESMAEAEIRLRTLQLIDVLHAENQRRAINLDRMEE